MGGIPDDKSITSFHDLLAEPMIRLVMEADNVDVRELRALLSRMAESVGSSRDISAPSVIESSQQVPEAIEGYRRGVGIMLMNDQGRIFVGQRIDVAHEAWQMPQGGIEEGEAPQDAAIRELREELGTSKVEIVTSTDSWFQYDLPSKLVGRQPGRRWQGQLQKWFFMHFQGTDADINIATEHPEFSHWQWVAPERLVELVVPFKRQLYVSVLEELAGHLTQTAAKFGRNDAAEPPA